MRYTNLRLLYYEFTRGLDYDLTAVVAVKEIDVGSVLFYSSTRLRRFRK